MYIRNGRTPATPFLSNFRLFSAFNKLTYIKLIRGSALCSPSTGRNEFPCCRYRMSTVSLFGSADLAKLRHGNPTLIWQDLLSVTMTTDAKTGSRAVILSASIYQISNSSFFCLAQCGGPRSVSALLGCVTSLLSITKSSSTYYTMLSSRFRRPEHPRYGLISRSCYCRPSHVTGVRSACGFSGDNSVISSNGRILSIQGL